MTTITPAFAGHGEFAPLDIPTAGTNIAHLWRTGALDAFAKHAARVGNCTNPIRLHGTHTSVNTATGEVLSHLDTNTSGTLYTRCGNRRAAICPSCSRLYSRDTFELIRAGVAGGKGTPDTVTNNPLVFATLTAPSFGRVHSTTCGTAARQQKHTRCSHGKPLHCNGNHNANQVGEPLCTDCYDYTGHVIWQWWAPELWRRFTIALRRLTARFLGVTATTLKHHAVLQYAKVAEYQARGAIHFHALIRIDGPKTAGSFAPAPTAITAQVLQNLVTQAITAVSFDAPPHAPGATPYRLRFGTQHDVTTVRVTHRPDDPDTALTGEQVAGYLAKYATKSAADDTQNNAHIEAIKEACDYISATSYHCSHGEDAPYRLLHKWSHMLGFRGHFATKSRAYSVTLGFLRRARAKYARIVAESQRSGNPIDVADIERKLLEDNHTEQTTLVINTLTYAGHGWTTILETELARAAATRAQEYAQWKSQQPTRAIENDTATTN